MSVAFALMTAPVDAPEPTIAPGRRAPVIVAAGGREIATTVRAGALVADRLGRAMSLVSVIEPVPTGIWDGDNFPLRGTVWEELAGKAREAYPLARRSRTAGAGCTQLTVERSCHAGCRRVPRAAARVSRRRPSGPASCRFLQDSSSV